MAVIITRNCCRYNYNVKCVHRSLPSIDGTLWRMMSSTAWYRFFFLFFITSTSKKGVEIVEFKLQCMWNLKMVPKRFNVLYSEPKWSFMHTLNSCVYYTIKNSALWLLSQSVPMWSISIVASEMIDEAVENKLYLLFNKVKQWSKKCVTDSISAHLRYKVFKMDHV